MSNDADAKLLDVIEFENYSVAVAVPDDNKKVVFALKSKRQDVVGLSTLAFSLDADTIVYIVNLLRGSVIGKLSEQSVLMLATIEKYKRELKEEEIYKLITLMSEHACNVRDVLDEYDKDSDDRMGLCNVIHSMAVLCRITLLENK